MTCFYTRQLFMPACLAVGDPPHDKSFLPRQPASTGAAPAMIARDTSQKDVRLTRYP